MLYREPPRGQRIAFARSLTCESKPLASTVPKYAVLPSSAGDAGEIDEPGASGDDRIGRRCGVELLAGRARRPSRCRSLPG